MWDIAGDSFEDEGMLEVQSDHYEVVADLIQTSFLFSIPMDGPMSFSTPHVSLQWALRFEFFTTPKNVDWTRLVLPINSPLLYLYDSSENNKNKNIVVFLSVLGFPRKSRGQSSFNAMDEWFRPPSDNVDQCNPVNSAIVRAAKHLPRTTAKATCACPSCSNNADYPFYATLFFIRGLNCSPRGFMYCHLISVSHHRFCSEICMPCHPLTLVIIPMLGNPQIHSTFEVGESLAHSKSNVQVSSSSLGIAQEQLEGF
ncbi:hypothetical protein E6C27_scaffold428G001180 [Cucumis melo var. makuwa]|uniref:Uncharacterized protein n=1 Tax=Cucumis melo var. makuwa TaxID=1194695 RepID=A0A5A7UDZ6_CUCMM|nr:hypothetical protein E6C27_scaffold428G001180 [Cucumis melo var. makuwa]